MLAHSGATLPPVDDKAQWLADVQSWAIKLIEEPRAEGSERGKPFSAMCFLAFPTAGTDPSTSTRLQSWKFARCWTATTILHASGAPSTSLRRFPLKKTSRISVATRRTISGPFPTASAPLRSPSTMPSCATSGRIGPLPPTSFRTLRGLPLLRTTARMLSLRGRPRRLACVSLEGSPPPRSRLST